MGPKQDLKFAVGYEVVRKTFNLWQHNPRPARYDGEGAKIRSAEIYTDADCSMRAPLSEEINPWKLLADLNYLAANYNGNTNQPYFVDVGYGRITIQANVDYEFGGTTAAGPMYLMAKNGECAALKTVANAEAKYYVKLGLDEVDMWAANPELGLAIVAVILVCCIGVISMGALMRNQGSNTVQGVETTHMKVSEQEGGQQESVDQERA